MEREGAAIDRALRLPDRVGEGSRAFTSQTQRAWNTPSMTFHICAKLHWDARGLPDIRRRGLAGPLRDFQRRKHGGLFLSSR